jgi:hypothetical protein
LGTPNNNNATILYITNKNIAFDKFYFSSGRKEEYNTVMNIKTKEE